MIDAPAAERARDRAPSIPLSALAEGAMLSLRDDFGLPVIVTLLAGRPYAFEETCTHRRCSLLRGAIEDDRVCCPCHGAEFDIVTGAVREGPATEPIRTYPVRVLDDVVVVEA